MVIRVTTPDGKKLEFPTDTTLSAMIRELKQKGAIEGDCRSFAINIEFGTEQHDNSRTEAGEDRCWGAPWPGADFSGGVTL